MRQVLRHRVFEPRATAATRVRQRGRPATTRRRADRRRPSARRDAPMSRHREHEDSTSLSHLRTRPEHARVPGRRATRARRSCCADNDLRGAVHAAVGESPVSGAPPSFRGSRPQPPVAPGPPVARARCRRRTIDRERAHGPPSTVRGRSSRPAAAAELRVESMVWRCPGPSEVVADLPSRQRRRGCGFWRVAGPATASA